MMLGLISCIESLSQTLSNKGKEFWVGYGHHQFMEGTNGSSQEMILYFSAEQSAHVVVTINGTNYREEYDIPANSVVPSKLIPKGLASGSVYDARLYTRPPGYPGGTGSEGIFRTHGIHIESDVPIVAYAHIYGGQASGATMLMPVETWGYSYVALNTRQTYNTNGKGDCFSWIYIVARQNNTRVRILPTVPTRNGKPAGVAFDVDLQKGEIFQLMGALIDADNGYDLTGTSVKSIANDQGACYPVAVFVGSSRTAVTCDNLSTGSGDNIMQQMFAYQAWGKRYLTAPTSVDASAQRSNLNIFRILVRDPNTVVKKNGQQLFGFNGYYYEYQSDKADYIEADKPILVAQFIPSSSSCSYTGNGDPELIYISPVEQSIKQIGFYRNSKENIDVSYLTLIIPTKGISSLRIDGQLNGHSYTYTHPNIAGYSVVVKRWPKAQAQTLVSSDSAFTAITYGFGNAESYGYNAGTLINNLSGIPSVDNEFNPGTTPSNFTCVNTPAQLSVLLRYQPTRLQWKLSQLSDVIAPSADIDISPASYFQGVEMVNGLMYYKYTLPQSYKFNRTGFFNIPVLATHSSVETCNFTEEVQYMVEVRSGLQTDFDIVYDNCKLSELISFNAKSAFDQGVAIKSWRWELISTTDTTGVTGQHVRHTFNVGNYTARLVAVSNEGCVADTTKSFKLSDKPAKPDFKVDAPLPCEGEQFLFSELSPETGVRSWYWDFGGKDTLSVFAGGTTQNKVFVNYDTINVKHVSKFSESCVSDTAVLQVIIYARPALSIAYPAGCLPTDGVVQFTSTSIAPDGQALKADGYAWNFGDPLASAANPNTSAAIHPTHQYQQGSYDILYSAVSEKGCSKDSTINAVFNVRALLNYPALSSICESETGISVAKADVLNGVNGTGYYRGAGTDVAGNFSPSAAGAGDHVISYIFTSSGNCIDSVQATIHVYPKPVAFFTAGADICMDQSAFITDASSVSEGAISSWHWDFGDGTSAIKNSNESFQQAWSGPNTYLVKLSATSDQGCKSDTASRQVVVHPLPVAEFRLPDAVCLPGAALFTNLSTVADNSPLSFTWNLGDGNTAASEKDLSHVYTRGGAYSVSLVATSSFGCVSGNDNLKILSAFYDKPQAGFKVNPAELCQGASNVFTDQSAASGSSVKSWHWDFADGESSAEQNPVKQYTAPGRYDVQLVVTSEQGCQSDPGQKTVTVHLQPVIDAGTNITVAQGTLINLKATANDPGNLRFEWSPAAGLSDAQLLNPSLYAWNDQLYTLTATGQHDCKATDQVAVKILRQVNVPNVFSPNGDGVNDTWQIPYLAEYPGAMVEVFTRNGQSVYRSNGYSRPWKGDINGRPLPVGTYYYLIQLKNGFEPLKGSVTILR